MCNKTDSWWVVGIQHRESSLELCDDLEHGMGWRNEAKKGEDKKNNNKKIKKNKKGEDIYVCVCNYGWFLLLYGRIQHNIIKHLSAK